MVLWTSAWKSFLCVLFLVYKDMNLIFFLAKVNFSMFCLNFIKWRLMTIITTQGLLHNSLMFFLKNKNLISSWMWMKISWFCFLTCMFVFFRFFNYYFEIFSISLLLYTIIKDYNKTVLTLYEFMVVLSSPSFSPNLNKALFLVFIYRYIPESSYN